MELLSPRGGERFFTLRLAKNQSTELLLPFPTTAALINFLKKITKLPVVKPPPNFPDLTGWGV